MKHSFSLNDWQYASLVLCVVGAVNWAAVSLFKMDLVKMALNEKFLGQETSASLQKIAYVLIGAGGLMVAMAMMSGHKMPRKVRKNGRSSVRAPFRF
jgi:uncharacterized membrane protein YuzA (DUF378 family)